MAIVQLAGAGGGEPWWGGGAPGPSVTADGWPVGVIARVEVQPVIGGDTVVDACHDALLHVDVEGIVLEHSSSC